jgi:hypothetical protein
VSPSSILKLPLRFVLSLLFSSLPADFCADLVTGLGCELRGTALIAALSGMGGLISGSHTLVHPIDDIVNIAGTVDPGLLSDPPLLSVTGSIGGTNPDGILAFLTNLKRRAVHTSNDGGVHSYLHPIIIPDSTDVHPLSYLRTRKLQVFSGVRQKVKPTLIKLIDDGQRQHLAKHRNLGIVVVHCFLLDGLEHVERNVPSLETIDFDDSLLTIDLDNLALARTSSTIPPYLITGREEGALHASLNVTLRLNLSNNLSVELNKLVLVEGGKVLDHLVENHVFS